MTDTLLCIYLGAENPKSVAVADSSKIGIGYMIYVCIMYINLHVALHTPPVSITIVYIAEWAADGGLCAIGYEKKYAASFF